MTRNHLGIAMALLAMLCFAVMDALSKHLVVGTPILQLMWARAIALALFAAALLGRDGLRRALRARRPWLQTAVALLLVVEGSIFVLALKYLPLADAHALGSIAPLLVVALSANQRRVVEADIGWLAVLAGLCGVFVILRPGFQVFSPALLIPPGCALLWAIYQISSRFCSQADGPNTTLAWTAFVGLAATTATIPWNWVTPDRNTALLIVGTAMLGAAALFCLIKALHFARASTIQPFNNSALVWATLLGYLAFGQAPDYWTVAGAGIIVAAAMFAWHLDLGAPVASDGALQPSA